MPPQLLQSLKDAGTDPTGADWGWGKDTGLLAVPLSVQTGKQGQGWSRLLSQLFPAPPRPLQAIL